MRMRHLVNRHLERVSMMKLIEKEESIKRVFNTFGDYICVARKLKKATQKELAGAIGVDVSTVCRWEKGGRPPSNERILKKIAKTLEIDEAKVIEVARISAYPLEHRNDERVPIEVINPLTDTGMARQGEGTNKEIEYLVHELQGKIHEEAFSLVSLILKRVISNMDLKEALTRERTEKLVDSILADRTVKSGRKKAVS